MARYKPRYQKQTPRKTGRRVLILATALVLALSASAVPGIYAKYTQETKQTQVAKAPEFYFTSDYLTPEGAAYTLNPGVGGTASVSIAVRNYNGPKVAELPVSYTISVASSVPGETIYVTGAPEGTLTENKQSSAAVTLTGLLPGRRYTVTAVGTNGYSAALKAFFDVAAQPEGLHSNTRNFGDYVLLTLWADNASGTVTITVPAGLTPDATDDALESVLPGDTVTITLKPYESRSFRFFVTGTEVPAAIPVMAGDIAVPETELN